MNKKKMLDKINQQVQNLTTTARMVRALPDLEEAIDVYVPDSDSIHIKIPFDMPTYRKTRQKVAENGWTPSTTWTAPNGNKFTQLYQSGTRLIIIMVADHEKSTCRLVPDGEKTVPLMRAVCS